MSIKISKGADTGAISGLLYDLAESTSQDAFILEQDSYITDRVPLTEFTDDGLMHYPQIRVSFNKELSVSEKGLIAQELKNNDVNEFSIDGNYFIISIINFDGTNEQKKAHARATKRAVRDAVARISSRTGTEEVGHVQKHIRASRYDTARNAGDE